jgi:1-acyl-sn-glycerol-3-phosphate acyltransferase
MMVRALWTFLIVDPLIILSTVLCGTIAALGSSHVQSVAGRIWGRSLVRIAMVRLQVEGLERFPAHTACVITPNHLSYMDTPSLLSSIPVEFRFLAKEELFKIPFMGDHLKRHGHIAVPLGDPRAALKTLSKAAQTMQEGGLSLLVFPEGGRSETGELQEFQDGAAYLAIKAQAPIVPVALIGTRQILPMHGKIFSPGKVRVVFGEPIPTTGLTIKDRSEVTSKMRSSIVEMLKSA